VNSQDLIVQLVRDAAPVVPLPGPLRRASAWAAASVAAAAVGILVFGVRGNLSAAIRTSAFLVDVAFAVFVMCLGAWAALALAVPGAREQTHARSAALLALTGWAAVVVGTAIHDGQSLADRHWPACVMRVLVIGAVPAWLLLLMVRRAAPLQPAVTSALTLAAAAAAGAAAVEIICPIPAAVHVLAGHLGPVLLLTVIGLMTGRALLERAKR
jgi:hypothetical protein